MRRMLVMWTALVVAALAACADDGGGSSDPPIQDFNQPAAPTNLRQSEPDGTEISSGDVTTSSSVTFSAGTYDPDGSGVSLEVEVQPDGEAFTGVPNTAGAFVPSGAVASASMQGLNDGTGYRWRARAVDTAGHTSGWVEYAPTSQTVLGQYVVAAFIYASLALQQQCAGSAAADAPSLAALAAASLVVAMLAGRVARR